MVRPHHPGARLLLAILITVTVWSARPASAGTVTLAWDANVETDLAGYVVSWGTQPGVYTRSRDVGNVVTASVAELAAGTTYFFAVQAYNTSGLTSAYSAEVSATIPGAVPVAPVVTAITPASGPTTGGTAVSVSGSGFAAGATLTIGGVPAVGVVVLDGSTLTAVTPAHAAGAADIVVTVGGVASAPLAGGFAFVEQTRVKVKDVLPRSGRTKGGQKITVVGEEFVEGSTVTLGDLAASSVTVLNRQMLTAVVPPHARGAVPVAVRAPGGETATFVGFTYVDDDPEVDTDGDGLPDAWEHRYGLDPNSGDAAHGPDGDPDQDGATNAQEFRAGTHPRGLFRRYFAEGISTDFFTTRIALANPSADPVTVVLSFFTDRATLATHLVDLAPYSRATVDAADVPGLAGLAYSTTVEADRLVVADRQLSWDTAGYGGHAETGIDRAATRWYFAEGATHSGFDLFYLLQNPGDRDAELEVRYLLPAGQAPMVKQYRVPARSRSNIWVDLEDPALALTDVSAVITSTNGVPIIAERSMYLYVKDQPFGAGHNSAGIVEPNTTWFLAEGATGSFFDLFVLIANPTAQPADITATYLLPDGTTIEKRYQVAADSRFNIWVDYEDARLADTAVSTTIESTNGVPVIVERSMWWPGVAGQWTEAHNAPGATATDSRWAMAQGEQGGAANHSTYILLANTSAADGDVRVTLLFDDGTTVAREFRVSGRSRFNVDVGWAFPEARDRRFGAVVEGLGATPPELVVECATYWDAEGRHWAAGTDALAMPLTPATAQVAAAIAREAATPAPVPVTAPEN